MALVISIIILGSGSAVDWPNVVEKVKPSVVIIKIYDSNGQERSHGSGFFINEIGDVITNHHVIENLSMIHYSTLAEIALASKKGNIKRAEIITSDNKSYPVKSVIKDDKLHDLALISVDIQNNKVNYLNINDSIPKQGEDVADIGSPDIHEFSFSPGVVRGIYRKEGLTMIEHSAETPPGCSGSPLINKNGQVVGVIQSMEFSVIKGLPVAYHYYAIPAKSILNLTTLTVGPHGCKYSSIQKAINDSRPGYTINVQEGVYKESIKVDKRLAVLGQIDADGDRPVVDANGQENGLEVSANGTMLENFRIKNAKDQGVIVEANSCTIEGVYPERNGLYGMTIRGDNNILRKNRISNNKYGLVMDHCKKSILSDNELFKNEINFMPILHDNNNIDTSNFVGSKRIYFLYGASDIFIDQSANAGIVLCIKCNNITIKNNILENNNLFGICLIDTRNSNIENNIAKNNSIGIELDGSENITAINNTIVRNYNGIYLNYVKNCNLYRNNINENNFNFGGKFFGNATNFIDKSNLVDGKSIYFLQGVKNKIIDETSNAGTIYCINCENISIKNLLLNQNEEGIYLQLVNNSLINDCIISRNDRGINLISVSNIKIKSSKIFNNVFAIDMVNSQNSLVSKNNLYDNSFLALNTEYSDNNSIENNTVFNSFLGFHLSNSQKNVLKDNNINNIKEKGIDLDDSNNSIISGNKACNNGEGISLDRSGNNIIIDNEACRNRYGIFLFNSSGNVISRNSVHNNTKSGIDLAAGSNKNKIYLNNFKDNAKNADNQFSSPNYWISQNPITYQHGGLLIRSNLGNYWSDQMGSDRDGNGIMDNFYKIGSEEDSYPLVYPFRQYQFENK